MQETTTTTFRRCTAEDLPQLQEMVIDLYATDIGESDITSPDIGLTFKKLNQSPQCGEIVIFERNHELVGYAIVIFVWSNEFGGFFLDVDEVFVCDSARGKGVGKCFFNWLGTAYNDRGVVAFSLQVSPTNVDALRLYESIGFKRSSSIFLKQVR